MSQKYIHVVICTYEVFLFCCPDYNGKAAVPECIHDPSVALECAVC